MSSIKSYNGFNLILTLITLSSGALLASNYVSADDVVDEINITVPMSCTMSGTGMDSHNTNINNGTYTPDIGTTTMHVFCNDNEGFSIYAAGYTGDEIGGTNSNKLVGTSASGNAAIESGLATSTGNPDVSNWAMKLAITQDSGDTTGTNAFVIDSAPNVDLPSQAEQGATAASFSEYHIVPNEYDKVAHKISATDMTTNTGGAKITSTYAAYISKTQPADTYSGQVIYTLVRPSSAAAPGTASCEPSKICYNANANDVLGTMESQSLEKEKDWSSCNTYTDYRSICVVDGQQIDINTLPELDLYANPTLQAYNFKREGFGFAGWNDKNDGTGTNYGPNQTITASATIDQAVSQGLNLYANWIPSAGSLQGWTGCSSMSAGSVTALTDTRDNNTYAVAKLADGNCWMIENLRLSDSDSNNNLITISSSNTNNPVSTFTSLSATSDIWCTDSNETCINQNKLNTNNSSIGGTNTAGTTLTPSPNANTDSAQWFGYGNYYNWYTATAGTGTYSQASGNATGDICPSGWSMPTGYISSSDKGQYSALDSAMGGTESYQSTAEASNRWRSYPNNFLYSGIWLGAVAYGRGLSGSGNYWSRTANGSNSVGFLNFTSTSVSPGNSSSSKQDGRAMRCLAPGS